MVPLTFGRDIFNEGTFAQAACIITDGDEPLLIQWSFHGHNISSDQGMTTTNVGTRTSILSIGSVNHNHRGNYTCRASNLAGDRSYTAELKVNGRQELILTEKWRESDSKEVTGRAQKLVFVFTVLDLIRFFYL